MFYIIISILAGASIVVARSINASLAQRIGIFQGTFINYIVGLFFSGIFLFVSKDRLMAVSLEGIPLWAYLGGLLGVIVIVFSNYLAPRLSAFYFTIFLFVGQIGVGTLMDYTQTHTLPTLKVVGALLVFIGLTYNLIIDQQPVLKSVTE